MQYHHGIQINQKRRDKKNGRIKFYIAHAHMECVPRVLGFYGGDECKLASKNKIPRSQQTKKEALAG